MCYHLVSVVLGEHSSITNIGVEAFADCYALTSINLPDKLEFIDVHAFSCNSLERVVCNKKLKTIGRNVFNECSKLEDVQLASSSISFGRYPFTRCDRLIELADAAGFPSNTFGNPRNGKPVNEGAGVVPYLIARFERSERKGIVLVAHMHFHEVVVAHSGTEEEKIAAAKQLHPKSKKRSHDAGDTINFSIRCLTREEA